MNTITPEAADSTPPAASTEQLKDSHLRSILKAVSWRIVGTIDTILVSYFWTGDARKALVIGASEVITKIVLYYLHERTWTRISFGRPRPPTTDESAAENVP